MRSETARFCTGFPQSGLLYYKNRMKQTEAFAMEELISGYCRTQDAARMVLCEEERRRLGSRLRLCRGCAYRDVCEIGKRIRELEERT